MSTRPLRIPILAALALVIPLCCAHQAQAGQGFFGLSFGNAHVNLSLGLGSWDLYSHHFADPSWSLTYDAALDGYGEWLYVSGLGRVWRPWVTAAWRPYTHGQWVWVVDGWTWVAYEPWGYFPHHYGQWAYTTSGWVWQPGYVYHPADVVWVHTGGYVGWYARPPHGWSHAYRGPLRASDRAFNHGLSKGYREGYWDGWRDARYATFIERRYLGCENVATHARAHNQVLGSSSSSIGRLQREPSRSTVTQWTGRPITEIAVDRRQASVDHHTVTVVRPQGSRESVERHAGTTLEHALSPAASRRLINHNAAANPRSGAGLAPALKGTTVSTRRTGRQGVTTSSKTATVPPQNHVRERSLARTPHTAPGTPRPAAQTKAPAPTGNTTQRKVNATTQPSSQPNPNRLSRTTRTSTTHSDPSIIHASSERTRPARTVSSRSASSVSSSARSSSRTQTRTGSKAVRVTSQQRSSTQQRATTQRSRTRQKEESSSKDQRQPQQRRRR